MRTFIVAMLAAIVGGGLFAADLSALRHGQNVRLVVLRDGPVRDGRIEGRTAEAVTVALARGGQLVRIANERIVEIRPEKDLTKKRKLLRIAAGAGAIAALSIIPMRSKDPESWLLLANGVIPALVGYAAAQSIPAGRGYLIRITCPDNLHCF